MSALDEFVNSLPHDENVEQVETPVESQPQKTEVETSEDSEKPEEEKIPFDKNPKLKKYIDRMVEKRLSKVQPQVVEREEVKPSTDVPYEFIAMYGDTEETRKAWNYQKKLLDDVETRAEQRALATIREEQSKFQELQETENRTVEDFLEDVGEKAGVDFDSDDETRKGYLTLMERLSPKDEDGNITEYADPYAVWEIYASRKTKDASRNKNLASRSMAKSSEVIPVKEEYEQGTGFDGARRKIGLD